MSKFDELFEETSVTLYTDFQAREGLLDFLQNKLPIQYGIKEGVMVNNKKELSNISHFFYNALTCPNYSYPQKESARIFPANFIYGTLSYISELNQVALTTMLAQKESYTKVYQNQLADQNSDLAPLHIWIANDLSKFISLNDLEDRLLAEENPPDLVAILNRGILVRLNESTITQVFELSQKEKGQAFDRAIRENLIDITNKTMGRQFFKLGATAAYKNFYYFYVILLNLLNKQTLPEGGLSADLVSIW